MSKMTFGPGCRQCGEPLAAGTARCPACGAAQTTPGTPGTVSIVVAVLLLLCAVPFALGGGFCVVMGANDLTGSSVGYGPFALGVGAVLVVVGLLLLAAAVVLLTRRARARRGGD